jgi:DNA helicase IV
MACDDEVIPLDAADLREVYETERHLLYVACTRARVSARHGFPLVA